MTKVLIYGNCEGAYRTQGIIYYLLNRKDRYELLIPNFSILFYSKNVFLKSLFLPARIILEIIFVVISDVIYIPALTHKSNYKYFLANFFRKKIITDFYISEYDTLVLDYKKFKSDSVDARNIYIKDRNAILKSSIIIFLNFSELNYYTKLLNIDKSSVKYEILPLYAPYRPKSIRYLDGSTENSFNVCWWGSFIPLHGLEKLIYAFSKLKNQNINLYIFGSNRTKAKEYIDLVNSLSLEQRIYFDFESTFANGRLVSFLQSQCDLAIGHFGDSGKAKIVLLNKFIDALSMEIPILSIETEAIRELIDRNSYIKCGNDINSIANKIDYCFENRALIRQISKHGHAEFNEKFSYSSFTNMLNSKSYLFEK